MDEQDHERQRRIEVLSALGQRQARTPSESEDSASAGGEPVRRRRVGRRLLLLALAVVVVLGGALAYLVVVWPQPPVKKPMTNMAPLTLDLETANLYCPQAFAWSHDGHEIAVLGADITCREQAYQGSPQGQKVGILDTRTGALTQTLTISNVFAQQGLSATIINAIAWAPDDSALVVFSQDTYSASTQTDNEALIVYPLKATDRTPRLLFAPQPLGPQQIVWNLQTMSVGPTIGYDLPPALTYRWTPDGHIAADQAMPSDITRATGRSAPSGSFSVWQDGWVDPEYVVRSSPTSPGQPPDAQFFDATPALWSPDQHFVVFGPWLGGPVAINAASGAPVCVSPGRPRDCLPSLLPLPDAAFGVVLKAAIQGETLTGSDGIAIHNWPSVPVQWSPDGKYLLTLLPGDEQREHFTTITATVFDVATGKQAKQYHLSNGQGSASCGATTPLAWSPAGGQIALMSCTPDTITILNTSDLSA